MAEAIILAAGRGSRLGTHTARRPKCAVRLGGRSLLQWQIDALHAAGVRDITLVVGYRDDAIADVRVRKIVNPNWRHEGPVASLLRAGPRERTDDLLVLYGDCVLHPDWLRKLLQSRGDIAITTDEVWRELWSLRFADVHADAERFVHRDGHLLAIGERATPADDVQGQFTGLLKFSRRGWSHIDRVLASICPADIERLDMTTLLSAALAHGVAIATVPIRGRWCEIDSENDLALYRKRLRRRAWLHDWRWEARP